MSYSKYTLDQIMSEDYEKMCSLFLDIVKDEKRQEQMKRYII